MLARLYLLLIFLCVFLPAGSIYGVNVKVLLSVACLLSFAADVLLNRVALGYRDVWFLALTACFLALWAIIGVVHNYDAFGHSRDLASTIGIAWFGIFLIRAKVLRSEQVIATTILAVAAMCCLKLAAVGLAFSGTDSVALFEQMFGEASVLPGDISVGLIRIQFPADILCPLALLAVLVPDISGLHLHRIWKVAFIVLVSLATFATYSRYIWFLFVAVLLSSALLRRKWKLLVATCVIAVGAFLYLTESVSAIYEDRFLSAAVGTSDAIRREQAVALWSAVKDSPWFGMGIGSHVNGLIRAETHPYSYEVQWLALLAQFGILGMLGIALLLKASLSDLLRAAHPAKKYLLAIFVLWLLGSFTNPYLTSSFAGVAFAFFMALFYRLTLPCMSS